jgi:translation initiation factor 3 subunit I
VITLEKDVKATSLGWTIADQYLIAGFDSGFIVKYDPETGKEIQRKKLHNDRVNRINFNAEKTMFITASRDNNAHLIDPNTLEIVKTYKTDRPVNGAVISPVMARPHILLGGGQDAQSVTTTSAAQGKFETRFYHMVYGDEFARVKGHFGPINALDIHPFGKSFASGSEDGFFYFFIFYLFKEKIMIITLTYNYYSLIFVYYVLLLLLLFNLKILLLLRVFLFTYFNLFINF